MRIAFTIPSVTPSLNVWQRAHHRNRTKARTMFGWECKAMLPPSWTYPADGRVRVAIVRCARRRMDTDNLYGGVKPLLDGLKDAGAIVDDDTRWIDLVVTQEVIQGLPETRIVLEWL